MLKALLNDECGVIISAELVLVLTIAVLAMIVGLSEVAVAVNTELNDISNAIGSLNQSFSFTGFQGSTGGTISKSKSFFFGSTFHNDISACDNNTSCDLITGVAVAEGTANPF